VSLQSLPWLATDTLTTDPIADVYRARAEDLAFLQYTSGSTGRLKSNGSHIRFFPQVEVEFLSKNRGNLAASRTKQKWGMS